MKKFTGNNFLELLFANLVKNNDFIVSKTVIQESLTDSYLNNHYSKLFENISMKVDKEETKKGNYRYFLDLEDAFENAVEQGQVLKMTSVKDMYMINFSENIAEQIISLYLEDEDFGKEYTNSMRILVKYVKVR